MRILRTSGKQRDNIVVLFSSNYAKILVNPKGLEFYKRRENALVNPPIERLKKVPMQYWKKQGDSITVMTPWEMTTRDFDIKKNGVDHDFDAPLKRSETHIFELIFMLSLGMNVLTVLYVLSRLIYG